MSSKASLPLECEKKAAARALCVDCPQDRLAPASIPMAVEALSTDTAGDWFVFE